MPPIALPDGKTLATLREAVAYLSRSIPRSERDHPAVLQAAKCLTAAAEGRDFVHHARIAVGQALRRNDPLAPFDPAGKDPHWGRRKLKRD